MSEFEVVRSDVAGWDVRRSGEKQALSNYATKELAEQAARKEQDVEGRSGGTADAIDIRQDIFSEGPEEDLDVRKTALGVGVVMVAVIVLIVLAALFVVITGITN